MSIASSAAQSIVMVPPQNQADLFDVLLAISYTAGDLGYWDGSEAYLWNQVAGEPKWIGLGTGTEAAITSSPTPPASAGGISGAGDPEKKVYSNQTDSISNIRIAIPSNTAPGSYLHVRPVAVGRGNAPYAYTVYGPFVSIPVDGLENPENDPANPSIYGCGNQSHSVTVR